MRGFKSSQISVITLVVFTTYLSCSSNEPARSVSQAFQDYQLAVRENRLTDEAEFIYPPFFEMVPKDSLIRYRSLDRTNIKSLTLGKDSIENISDELEVDGIRYVLINYSQEMIMDFSDIKNQGGASLAIGLMSGKFSDEYGESNVVFDKGRSLVKIKLRNQVYGIYDHKYADWKFLQKTDPNDSLMSRLIPAEVREKL